MISSSIKKSCWQCLDSVGVLELSINLIKETWRWELNPYFPIWNPELYHWTTETLRPLWSLKGSLSPILTASFSHKKNKIRGDLNPCAPLPNPELNHQATESTNFKAHHEYRSQVKFLPNALFSKKRETKKIRITIYDVKTSHSTTQPSRHTV